MRTIECNADIEPCLSVVMPAYNEVGTVSEVVNLVLAQRPGQQLVIVDDAVHRRHLGEASGPG